MMGRKSLRVLSLFWLSIIRGVTDAKVPGEGVTDSTIRIGILCSLTGPASGPAIGSGWPRNSRVSNSPGRVLCFDAASGEFHPVTGWSRPIIKVSRRRRLAETMAGH
jgi:hypothetical protein